MNETLIDDSSPGDLEDVLRGRSITAAEDVEVQLFVRDLVTLTLDDGTVVKLQDSPGCHGGFNAKLRDVNLTDNVVTAVVYVDHTADGHDPDDDGYRYDMVVLAADQQVCTIEVEGDPTRRCFCTSLDMLIETPND